MEKNKQNISLNLKKKDLNEPQDCALNKLIDLNKRKRDLLRRLLQGYMERECESANVYFDIYIEELRGNLSLALDILYDISKSKKKFDEEIEHIGDQKCEDI